MSEVYLRSKVGEFHTSSSAGGRGDFSFHWVKGNDFTTKVPTEVRRFNSFGQEILVHENYAQVLLDAYPDILEFAGAVTDVKPPVVERREEDLPLQKRRGRPPKKKEETKHEDVEVSS